jgi:ABC-type multidrug transport system fused ATPase/permease subunit
MIEFLLSLSDWAGGVVSMVGAAALGLVVYLVSYKLISKYQSDELRDPTNNLFRVVGIIVSLMLSLAFADVVVDVRKIESAVEREAVAISDTFENLQSFGGERAREIRIILIDYTQAVIDDDWPALANDKLGERAGVLRKQLTESVLDLEPTTSLQEKLFSKMLTDLDAISDYRLIRLDNAMAQPPVYIRVVFLGFLFTMACFGVYRPQAPLVVLVSLYAVFIGLILYLILALSDPFQGGFGADSTTFEYLVEAMRSKIR